MFNLNVRSFCFTKKERRLDLLLLTLKNVNSVVISRAATAFTVVVE